jgi:hypothetical protein
VTSEEREEIRKLRKENFELRRANEILKAASVFFATELDPGAAARLAVLGPDGPPLTGRLRCAYKQRRLRGRAQPQAEQGVLPSTPSYTDLGAGSLEHDDAPASLARSALQRSPPKRFTRPTETTGAPNIGAWHNGVPSAQKKVFSVLQNQILLVDRGVAAATVTSCVIACWGDTVYGLTAVPRSGLGITAS